jgi:Sortase domain
MFRRNRPEAAGTEGTATVPSRRGPSTIAVGAAVLALIAGAWLMYLGTQTHQPPTPSTADRLAAGHGSRPGTVAPMPPSAPVRVRIPAIHVDAPMMPLGVDKHDALEVPPDGDSNMAGWYEYGATPGERGAAVVAGHVDTRKGPAVFYNLGSLHKGNTVQITRRDHRTAVFTVYGVEVYAKDRFPTERIYQDTPAPELRVITCGGGFSKASNSYLGNVVAYARLTAVK